MNKDKIVCIGHDENALIFNASGIKGIVSKKSEVKDLIFKQINEGVKIILISHLFKEEVEAVRAELEDVYPIILMIALDGSNYEDGVEQIRKDVERAIGINIL